MVFFLCVNVQIKYEDGDEENLILSNEKIRFHVSREELKQLNLSSCNISDYDAEELLALAASLDNCQDFEPGEVVWAKLTGLCSIQLNCF